MSRPCFLLLLLSFFTACEKAITIRPGNPEPLLVVDGSIDDGQPPIIVLSNSINYFSNITRQILAGSIINNATVVLSDGINSRTLKPYPIPIGQGYNLYVYTNDVASPSTAILGKQGSAYSLRITYNNKQYISNTTIPIHRKKVDSLWWTPAPGNVDPKKVFLMARVTDPPGYGDYIRYFTRVNSGNFLPGINSAFDDQVTDGKTYDVIVDQGIDRNDPPKDTTYGYFNRGDTITTKFTNTDKATYDFWRTVEFGYQSVGNPFSSPTKVLGNVSNGALGAFCGYSVQYNSLIIPK